MNKILIVAIPMKATEQFFPVVLFIVLYKEHSAFIAELENREH